MRPGIIGLSRLVELLSTGPARVLGLPGGTLKKGSPADLSLFHTDRYTTVKAASFKSRGKNTPFEGWKLKGKAFTTIVGGRRIELPKS